MGSVENVIFYNIHLESNRIRGVRGGRFGPAFNGKHWKPDYLF